MKRRLFLIILLATVTLSGMAQNIGEAFYIYRNDGQFNAFFRDEVISIDYSYEDAEGNTYDEIVTQLVYTADSLYRIPLASIDSVGFVQPKTVYKEGTKPLVGVLFDYLVSSDSLSLIFDSSIPSALLPNIGDKLVATDLTDKLPLGFMGTVRQVEQSAGGYVVLCDSLLLEEAVDQFYGMVEINGKHGEDGARRYLLRRAYSEQTSPSFRIVIPTINQKLDLTPIISPKDVYTINGKAVVDVAIHPVFTGRITRVVDNKLNISHYNIHAVTDVTTVTTIEAVGEVTNSDNPLNLSSSKTSFCIEGTKPGPWGIPIYYAFGPKFDMSGELAIGTTVYANFTQTEDITYYPLTTAIGVVAPGLYPLVNQINTVIGSTKLTHFDIDWLYIAGRISARVAIVGRLGIGLAAKGKNAGWVGGEAQIGAKAEAELGLDFEALSNAEQGTGFYDSRKDNAKVVVMPYWGLEGKVSVMDDRFQFTFLGRDDYSFWGKKWEWDFLPKFSDTEANIVNGSDIKVSANIINDCIIPYTVGFSLFDDNNNRIREPKWNKQKYWTRNGFNFPFETTFDDVVPGKKYKVYPTLRLFGFNVPASPSADVQSRISISTFDAYSITSKSAYLVGELSNYGPGVPGVVYFYYGINYYPQIEGSRIDVCSVSNMESQEFSINLTGLQPNTTYYYVAVYDNGEEPIWGSVKSFTTTNGFSIETTDATGITASGATLQGKLLEYEESSLTEYGIGYSETPDNFQFISASSIDGDGNFSVVVSGLAELTTYYYVAYARNSEGKEIKGETLRFKTGEAGSSCLDNKHPHMIDLGLPSGTKWACCNEGADSPEQYGYYFTWYDARYFAVPSLAQQQEIVKKCKHTKTVKNGVSGELFTGPNGASIFFPAAGCIWYDDLKSVGTKGYYWSSTLSESNPTGAWFLYFLLESAPNTTPVSTGNGPCELLQSVRIVSND